MTIPLSSSFLDKRRFLFLLLISLLFLRKTPFLMNMQFEDKIERMLRGPVNLPHYNTGRHSNDNAILRKGRLRLPTKKRRLKILLQI